MLSAATFMTPMCNRLYTISTEFLESMLTYRTNTNDMIHRYYYVVKYQFGCDL